MLLDTQAITLTCTSGIRPGELIAEVLEGTELTPIAPEIMVLGMWTWVFNMSDDDWQEQVVPVVAPRIESLREQGLIESGAW